MPTVPSPRNVRAAISRDELRDLYVMKGLTIERVAAQFGVAATTIRRRLKEVGIGARRRGPVPGFRQCTSASVPRKFEWTADVAYAVGVIATDGCLGHNRSQLTVTSKDVDLLETVRHCLGMAARITLSTNPRPVYRLQWRDVLFHRWLIDIGLTPAKSLTLGPLAVPDPCFVDFFRGCIDGDGSIVTYVDRYNTFKSPAYVYTRLYVSIVSASRNFVDWLRTTVQRLTGLSGSLAVERAAGRNDLWRLRFAKRESLAVLRWMYYTSSVPCLRRKLDIAAPFLAAGERPPRRGPGRPMVV